MRAPEPLNSKSPLAGFDCGKPSLNDWLQKHALQAQVSGSARTFVVTDNTSVLGYYSLVVGQVEPMNATERIRKGMGQYPIPVMLLARLAVNTTAQSQGIGSGLLQDATRRALNIAEQAGIRAMLTHPIDDDAAPYHHHFGFEASPLGQGQLLLLLKDAKRWV